MPDETLRQPLPGGEYPDPMQLFQDAWKEFTDDLGPYMLAGLGQLCVVLPVVLVLFFVIYFGVLATLFGGIFVGAIAGVAATETLGSDAGALVFLGSYLGSFVLMFVVIFGLSLLIGALMAPLNASMVRRVAEHQRGGRKLDFTAIFSDVGDNLMGVIGVQLLISTIVFVGILLCYVPGLLAAFMLVYATSLVALHRAAPMTAVRTSLQSFTRNPGFHGMFTLLYFCCSMLAAYVPIVGPMFMLAVHIRAHRTLFGDGPEPVTPLLLEG